MNQKYITVLLCLLFLLVAMTIFVKPVAIKAILAIATVILSGYFYSSYLSSVSMKVRK
ncbi:hypothetical protein IGL07_002504 [Enterococcus sp. DIV1368f]|nr:hypothetical protein WMI_02470 [Enterococcus faecalis EnGen0363]